MSDLDMIARHLSVSITKQVDPRIVAKAMIDGYVPADVDPTVRSALDAIFVETVPEQILGAAGEAGASLIAVNRLYRTTRAAGAPKCPEWERIAREIIE